MLARIQSFGDDDLRIVFSVLKKWVIYVWFIFFPTGPQFPRKKGAVYISRYLPTLGDYHRFSEAGGVFGIEATLSALILLWVGTWFSFFSLRVFLCMYACMHA